MSTGRERWRGLAVGLCLSAVAAVLVLAPGAMAQSMICAAGSGAGQCEAPRGVAVDFESGRTYVADSGNNRIDVFESDGNFAFAFGWKVNAAAPEEGLQTCTAASGCLKGSAGVGAGQFSAPTRVVVDNEPLSPAHHDVYVGTDNFRVQRFGSDGGFKLAFGWGVRNGAPEAQTCGPVAAPPSATCLAGIQGSGSGQFNNRFSQDPIAIGSGGTVYLGDASDLEVSRIELFAPDGGVAGEVALPHVSWFKAIAVNPAGDVYVAWGDGDGVIKYGPGGASLDQFDDGIATTALAVDETGDLMSVQQASADGESEGFLSVITLYDSFDKHLRRWGYDVLPFTAAGVASRDPVTDGVIVGDRGDFIGGGGATVRNYEVPLPGPIVPQTRVKAPSASVANTKAKISAEINPEGKATTYRFQYLDRQSYEAQGESFEGPATEEVDGPVGAEDFELHRVEVPVGCSNPTAVPTPTNCLTPSTKYVFRVLAVNVDGQGNTPIEDPAFEFETKEAGEILGVFASRVGTDAAQLGAAVNPLGLPTSGYFEYVTEPEYQASIDAGGDGFVAATQVPNVKGGEAPLDFGSGEADVTRKVTVFPLAQDTAYRYRLLISDPLIETPIVSGAGALKTFPLPTVDTCPSNEAFRGGPSALLPDCRAYEMVSPLNKANGDIVVLANTQTAMPAVLNQSSSSGERLAYGSYRAFGDTKSAPYTAEYIARREAGREWSSTGISPPRGRAVVSPPLQTDTEIRLLSPDLCTTWIQTYAEPPLDPSALPGNTNLYRKGSCAGEGYEALTTVTPPNASVEEFAKGLELQGASADGSHAIYLARDNLTAGTPPQPVKCTSAGELCESRLYEKVRGQAAPRFVCVLPSGAPSAGSCTAGSGLRGNQYRGANLTNALSADGERIFWTADDEEGKIYVRIGGTETKAVSKAAEQEVGATESRFWAAASDGSKAIFTVSTPAGDVLYEFDVDTGATLRIGGRVPGVMGASQDAKRVYFVSREVLAAGATEDEPNLYLYEAGQGGGSYRFVAPLTSADANRTPAQPDFSAVAEEPRFRASRVSRDGLHAAFIAHTNPTGYDNTDAASPAACGEPEGICDGEVYLYDASGEAGAGKLICASCNPSNGRPLGASRISVFESNLYAPRVLSDDGSRLFFESDDSLVAHDTNGRRDVYQWEAIGSGGCDATDFSFSAAATGCIELISSGLSNHDAEFVDASPTGGDVFFATLSSLLPQDYGLVDIYDARVGGGLPTPPEDAPPCEGEACQNPPPPPPVTTPASASPQSRGNVKEKPKSRCPKGKRAVRRSGKTRCVKPKKHKSGKAHKRRTKR